MAIKVDVVFWGSFDIVQQQLNELVLKWIEIALNQSWSTSLRASFEALWHRSPTIEQNGVKLTWNGDAIDWQFIDHWMIQLKKSFFNGDWIELNWIELNWIELRRESGWLELEHQPSQKKSSAFRTSSTDNVESEVDDNHPIWLVTFGDVISPSSQRKCAPTHYAN